MRLWISALLLASAPACTSKDIVVGSLREVTELPANPNRELDLLFVVDNSPSMQDKQAALAANFPRMIDALSALDTGLPDLHIGVITSDMGTSASDGAFGPAVGVVGAGGCAVSAGDDGALVQPAGVADRWLSDVADPVTGGRIVNYTGALRDAFADLASVGGSGCGIEQPLAAMKRSFANPVNAGFVRSDANLAVVILSDEDDCSASNAALFSAEPQYDAYGHLEMRCFAQAIECAPDDMLAVGSKTNCGVRAPAPLLDDTQTFVDALLAQKPDPRSVMVAGIVGPGGGDIAVTQYTLSGGTPLIYPAPACQFTGPTAQWAAIPALRLGAFLDAPELAGRATNQTICTDDFSGPLDGIAQTARRLVGDPCFSTDGLLDTSAAEAGVQPACEVIDVRDASPDSPSSLPACSAGGGDCFELVADAHACPLTPDHLRVKIHRSGAVAAGTWTHIRCQEENP